MIVIYRNVKEANKRDNNFDFFTIKTVDNKGYWLYNNSIYYASLKNGDIDQKSIKKIEDFGMDPKEMYEMIGR
ncbi:MAG: hypothetical protein ACO295_05145 [Sediminibacterium sp.]